MAHKSKVPHSLLLKHRYAKTASALLERLPITQQFTASRRLLLQLLPVWQDWCLSAGKRHKQSFNCCQLTAFEKGVLSISAENANIATLIKHQADSLLTTLHKKGFNEIRTIRVHVQLRKQTVPHNSPLNSSVKAIYKIHREKPSETAVSALKSAAQNMDDPTLSASLERLAQTLNNRRKEE